MHSFGLVIALALQAACLATASPLSPRALKFDEVAVVGLDGRMVIMHASEYNQLEARRQTLESPPKTVRRQLESSPPKMRRQDCYQSTEVKIISDTTFTDSDVAMSGILGAQGGAAFITISTRHSIANNLKIKTGGLIKKIAKAVLRDAYKIDSDTTWTNTQTTTLRFDIPEGQYGLVVSQPLVRRIEGAVLSGCSDAPNQEPFTLDSYSSASFEDFGWVEGVIRLCNSTTYPVPYCSGEGSHE